MLNHTPLAFQMSFRFCVKTIPAGLPSPFSWPLWPLQLGRWFQKEANPWNALVLEEFEPRLNCFLRLESGGMCSETCEMGL